MYKNEDGTIPYQHKIAIFQATDSDFMTTWEERMETASGYVRVTEYADITFSPRAPEEITEALVVTLDLEADAIRNEAIQKLERIAKKKAEALCLTYVEKVTI
jgi:hypothetical protein